MGWARCVLLAALIATSAFTPSHAEPQAQAQPDACDASSGTARQFKFDGEAPFAGASIHEAMTRDCTSILLYRLTPKHPPKPIRSIEERRNPPPDNRPSTGAPVFYVRVHSKQGFPDISGEPLWADQRTCPALLPAVEALERALTPKLTGDGPVRNNQLYSTVDGASVTVWAAGQLYPLNNESHRFETTYRTNVGSPTAEWLQATLKALGPCLSAVMPTPDPPIP